MNTNKYRLCLVFVFVYVYVFVWWLIIWNCISYTLICVSEDYKWLMNASIINKFRIFRIREFNMEHTCPLKNMVYSQRQATSNLIGEIIISKLSNYKKKKYTPKNIINNVKLDSELMWPTCWCEELKKRRYIY